MALELVAGAPAPEFALADGGGGALRSEDLLGKAAVLIFVPARLNGEIMARLGEFQERLGDLQGAGAAVVAISTAAPEAMGIVSATAGLTFPLLSDDGGVAERYGVGGQAAVFVLDDCGVVRRVYDPEAYPSLPNPAMVVRALTNLAQTPRAAPVCDEDWCLGTADASVTLVEYADYQCVPCGATFRVLQEVLPKYEGKTRLIFRHLPIRMTHPLAQKAAEAAEAAGAQGKFWVMHTCLFEAQGALERDRLVEYAGKVGLDVDRFCAELDDGKYKENVNADFAAAQSNRVRLPPALFINGVLFEGPRTVESVAGAIDAILACSRE